MKKNFSCAVVVVLWLSAAAQTDIDGVMMDKNNLCTGPMYSSTQWTNYWEGTFRRDNANLGRVSTGTAAIMGNYGISARLNVLFNLPYVSSRASAGTLQKMKGLQDLSLWVKYMPFEKEVGPGLLSLYTIGGIAFPTTNYVADYLPLAIGLRSTNLSLRGMVDYQWGNWFGTASGTYIRRSNIKIDRTAYYTTEMHYTNEVAMPDASQWNLRGGFRNERLIAELVYNRWITLGGFDISKNNMPFPSNRMNATTLGLNIKYTVPPLPALSVIAGGNTTVAGRNVGQANTVYGGLFYIMDFSRKHRSPKAEPTSVTPSNK